MAHEAEEQQESSGYSGPAHLAPYAFKKGVSGNPNGRPKGRISLIGILEETLRENYMPGTDKSLARALVERTILDALNGDSHSRKLVWEYLEGKPGAIQQALDEESIVEIVDDI